MIPPKTLFWLAIFALTVDLIAFLALNRIEFLWLALVNLLGATLAYKIISDPNAKP
jgi:hypothetical protein